MLIAPDISTSLLFKGSGLATIADGNVHLSQQNGGRVQRWISFCIATALFCFACCAVTQKNGEEEEITLLT